MARNSKDSDFSEVGEVSYLCEAILLKGTIVFERSVETLVCEILCCELLYENGATSIRARDQQLAVDFISNRKYFSWFPYDNTLDLTDMLFGSRDANPFRNGWSRYGSIICEVVDLRNHVAHNSQSTQKRFIKIASNNPPRNSKLSVAAYLSYSEPNRSTRLEMLFNALYQYYNGVEQGVFALGYIPEDTSSFQYVLDF